MVSEGGGSVIAGSRRAAAPSNHAFRGIRLIHTLLLFVAAVPVLPGAARDFLPLATGNRWVYHAARTDQTSRETARGSEVGPAQ